MKYFFFFKTVEVFGFCSWELFWSFFSVIGLKIEL